MIGCFVLSALILAAEILGALALIGWVSHGTRDDGDDGEPGSIPA